MGDFHIKSKYHKFFIEEAKRHALNSTMCQRHGAIIVRKNHIIGFGYNYDYSQKIYHGHFSVHAEIAAIKYCTEKKIPLEGTILYVVRINKQCNLRNSKPCSNCAKWITTKGIRTVFYSINVE